MSDAEDKYADNLMDNVALYLPTGVFLPYDEYPDDTTLYVQAIAENNLGVGPGSEIVKVVLKR